MSQQIVQPATGYLVNIVSERLEEADCGVEVEVSYLTDYRVLKFTVQKWYPEGQLNFSIGRSLTADWSEALFLAEKIKEIAFDDYENTYLTDLIDRFSEMVNTQFDE